MLSRPFSACRQFRRHHAEFMDGYLSAEAQRACRAHLDECQACTNHDVRIRRSLLALQALPSIEPSAGFRDELHARLRRETLHYSPVPSRSVRWGMATAIVAASVALLFAGASRARPTDASRAAPVMAQAPASPAPRRPAPPPIAGSPAASLAGLSAVNTPRSRARFEALPGQGAVPSGPALPQGTTARLQAVSYIGQ